MLRLVSAGGSIEEFQWSSDEQVWPFERASDGSTLYCKEVDCGSLPNSGFKGVSHGILDLKEMVLLMGAVSNGALTDFRPVPYVSTTTPASMDFSMSTTSILLYTGMDRTGFNASVRLLYTKS